MSDSMTFTLGAARERRRAGAPAAGAPGGDISLVYLDRLLGRVRPGLGLIRFAIMSLGPGIRDILTAAIAPGFAAEVPSGMGDEDGGMGSWIAIRSALVAAAGIPPDGEIPERFLLRIEPELIEAFEADKGGLGVIDPFRVQRERLRSVLGLDEVEIDILCLLYTCRLSVGLDQYLDSLPLAEFHQALAVAVGSTPRETKSRLALGSRLVRMGFVTPDFLPPPHFALDADLVRFFADPDSLVTCFEDGDSLPLPAANIASFPVPALSRDILSALLLRGRGSVLIHGIPGTGKTSFARVLLHDLGVKGVFMTSRRSGESTPAPFIRIGIAAHFARSSGAVLVIDEADALLNTEGFRVGQEGLERSWLVEFMDSHEGAVIWIANDIGNAHDAIKRRFLYSLEFRGQSERQRRRVWEGLLRDYGLEGGLGEGELAELAKRYEVNAGGIDIALRGLAACVGGGRPSGEDGASAGPGGILLLEEILGRHCLLMGGAGALPARGARRGGGRFLPEAVNADVEVPGLVRALSGVAASIIERGEAERNGFLPAERARDQDAGPTPEARLLFSGPSGTGKTAFARWLAEELGLPLIQRRASDLLSAFVGQTEMEGDRGGDRVHRRQARRARPLVGSIQAGIRRRR